MAIPFLLHIPNNHTLSIMFSPVSTPNSLRLRPPPPPAIHSSNTTLPSPTSPNIRSPRTSPLSATVYATAETLCFATSPSAIISPPSLYDILGISMGATESEIKTAYRQLARISHPDVKNSSGEEFMKIHSAYSTLSDPDKRAAYDRRLFRTQRSRSFSSVTPVAAASYYGCNGYSGRNWETDQCW